MIVKTGGPQPQVLELTNVVHVDRWLRAVEDRMRTRRVV
jgi:hypothetical protein